MAAFHVDNGKPPERQSDTGSAVETVVIRTPVTNRIGHRLQNRNFDRCFAPGFEYSANAAHDCLHPHHGSRGSCRESLPEAFIELLVSPYHRIDRKLFGGAADRALP